MENNNTANAVNEISAAAATQPTRWQLLRYKLLRWWLFNFRNKTIWEGEIFGFKFKFRKYWLDIRSTAPNHWNLRIGIANNAYGLLLASVYALKKYQSESNEEKANEEKLFILNFARTLYETSAYQLADVKFAKGLKKELDWAYNRLMRKAQAESDKVTKEQNDADEAFLRSVVDESNMSRAERRRRQREQQKEMRKVAKEIVKDM